MKEFHVTTPKLTAFTMDPILQEAVTLVANQARGRRREDVRLLLGDVKFIDPYGLVCLWAVVRHLRSRFRRVRVALPTDGDLQAYLRRMDFPTAIARMADIENEVASLRGSLRPSDVLLEMTAVEQQADVVKVTRSILGRIGQILKNELQYTERDITAFSTVVSEVCTNIFDHSEDKGIVAAQRYTQRDGTKYTIIGVADFGIGIRESLAKRWRNAKAWPHLHAIVNALQKEYSRHPERGLGLYMVSKIVGEYRGSLRIRSGNAQLYLRHRAQGFPSVDFPGTQISISLSIKE